MGAGFLSSPQLPCAASHSAQSSAGAYTVPAVSNFSGGEKLVRPFLVAYSFVSIIGATINLGLLWDIADTFNGLMAIPNLIALLVLSGQVKKLAIDVDQAQKSGTL